MTRVELQIWRQLLRRDYMRLSVDYYELSCAREYAELDRLALLQASKARRMYRKIRSAYMTVESDSK